MWIVVQRTGSVIDVTRDFSGYSSVFEGKLLILLVQYSERLLSSLKHRLSA